MTVEADEEQKKRQKALQAFISEFFKKQKEFADAYGLSESQVSGWLSEKVNVPSIPAYISKLIDITRENKALSDEVHRLKAERIIELDPGYALVRFPDAEAPGTILCRGIPDLDTAKNLATALRPETVATNKHHGVMK
jgi:transcriptional regulator with XRE-family HTH domain